MSYNVNQNNINLGLTTRERQKLRMPKTEDGGRELWPLSTNLMKENVAGPGMMLHFQFQAVIILWALVVALIWVCFAAFIDNDLFILGTRRFGTPRNNCILVAWGFETQQELMWTKVSFLWIVYIFTFAACIFHGVRQLRLFQLMDFDNKTMKDYVALAVDLPICAGTDQVEVELRDAIKRETEQNVVGVSIAWNYKDQVEDVMKEIDRRTKAQDVHGPDTSPDIPEEEMRLNPISKKLYDVEKYLFEEEPEEEEQSDESKAKDLLHNIETTSMAFVVFNTEEARDEACNRTAQSHGFIFRGVSCRLEKLNNEPATVQWEHFGHSSLKEKAGRLTIGFGAIFLAMFFWTTVFYAPYAWSVFSFNYDNGQEPGFVYGFTFSMVVVVGNAIMYEVCARVSDYVGFRFKDDREACYMVLYTIACTFNILLDMVTTYVMAWEIQKGLGFRTYDGRKLHEVDHFNERFETYAMQRSLAENTFAYAFPSTYLIPFLIEPLMTITLPLKIGVLIVRTHPNVVGRAAEEWIASVPMEMGRYADILLDVVLGILIFYFPGGYTHTLFFALAGSHLIIYAFDHWRVLRSIPSCCFATIDIDWWSQVMLIPCTAIIMSCLVFKTNSWYKDQGYDGAMVPIICTIGFIVHCIVHYLLLVYLVPQFAIKSFDGEEPTDTYEETNKKFPATYFSTNPVHCLRSHIIYQHKPPCGFFVSGREHLLEVNKEIGCFFSDSAVEVKNPDEDVFESGVRSCIQCMKRDENQEETVNDNVNEKDDKDGKVDNQK